MLIAAFRNHFFMDLSWHQISVRNGAKCLCRFVVGRAAPELIPDQREAGRRANERPPGVRGRRGAFPVERNAAKAGAPAASKLGQTQGLQSSRIL